MKVYFDNPTSNTWKRPQNTLLHWLFTYTYNEFVFFLRIFGITFVHYFK